MSRYALICFLIFILQPAFPANFHRIISLSPILTEEVFLLGQDSDLIADTIYCIHPEAAKKKVKIGNLIDFSIEKIIQMNPDLLLASSITDPRKLEKIKDMKIRLEVFSEPESFQEICDQFMRLAVLLGRENTAKDMILMVQGRVSKIKSAVDRFTKKRVFVQIGSDPLFTAGKNSFINDFIIFGGGINIAENSVAGIYSLEEVMKNDPEIIILSDMDNNNEKYYWQKFKSIMAVKQNAVYRIDSYHLCSPTPLSFATTLDEIVHMIHPEFKEMRSK